MFRSSLALALVALPLLACTGQVAEGPATGPDLEKPGAMPAGFEKASVDAKVARVVPRPDGKVAGLLLDDGSFVRVHADQVDLAAGDAVHVEGVKKATDGATVFAHAKVSKDGKVIVDPAAHAAEWKSKKHAFKKHDGDKKGWKKHGHFKKHFDLDALAPVTASSKVTAVVSGHPHGPRVLLLEDGTAAYLPHKADVQVQKGDAVTVTGKGGEYPIGRALVVQSIKLPSGEQKALVAE